MDEPKSWRLQRERPTPSSPLGGPGAVRWLIRVVLLAAIFALALVQGYSQRALALLGVAIVWAMLLPVILRGGALVLDRFGVEGRNRKILLAVMAGLLLAVFALGARLLVGSS